MPRHALLDSLKHLHTTLHAHPTLSAEDRAMLQTVLHDIQRTLDDNGAHAPATIERLEGAAISFETTHPELSSLARQVIAAVRNAGI